MHDGLIIEKNKDIHELLSESMELIKDKCLQKNGHIYIWIGFLPKTPTMYYVNTVNFNVSNLKKNHPPFLICRLGGQNLGKLRRVRGKNLQRTGPI